MSSKTKRLVLCYDGSSSLSAHQPPSLLDSCLSPSFSSLPYNTIASNPARLSRMLARHGANDVPQIVFYAPGRPSSSLEHDVAAAYLFLAANYAPGDEVAVFGAGTRGAAAARVVVSLVTEAGLLKPGEVGRWGRLWELYSGGWWRDGEREVEGYFWKEMMVRRSRQELDEIEELRGAMWLAAAPGGVRVRVVGVWDTVGDLGVPDDTSYLHGTALHTRIDHAFQALALDENRAAFRPSLWHLDHKRFSGDDDDYNDDDSRPPHPNLKQCWFPGFHETIGGGVDEIADVQDNIDIADITLAWMCDQVDGLLDFDAAAVAEFLGAEQQQQQQQQLISAPQKQHRRQPDRQISTRSGRCNDDRSADRSEAPTQVTTAGGRGSLRTLVTATTLKDLLLLAATIIGGYQQHQGEEDEEDGAEAVANGNCKRGCAEEKYVIRTPGQYHKNLEFETGAVGDDLDGDYATNESVHPSVKHRMDIFALASTPYNPAPLQEWAVGSGGGGGGNVNGDVVEGSRRKKKKTTGRLPWLSPSLSADYNGDDADDEDDEDDDDGEAVAAAMTEQEAPFKGRGANVINAATERVRAAGIPQTKPQPRWAYRERVSEGEGDGAEWIRPSVPRSELFGSALLAASPYSSSSSLCTCSLSSSPGKGQQLSRLRTLKAACLRRSQTSPSLPLYLLFLLFFWPWYLLYHILSPLFPFYSPLFPPPPNPLPKKKAAVKTRKQPPRQLQHHYWPHERQIILPEWVIRETTLPGTGSDRRHYHNFESRLLPWLVREQLKRRNARRLDGKTGEEVFWARPTAAKPNGGVIQEERRDRVEKKEEERKEMKQMKERKVEEREVEEREVEEREVEAEVADEASTGCAREKEGVKEEFVVVRRRESVKSSTGGSVAEVVMVQRRGSVKSSASGSGAEVTGTAAVATAVVKRRSGPLHVRKGSMAEGVVAAAAAAGAPEAPSSAGVGERRQSQTAAGGTWRSTGNGGNGGGLKVLTQQPERRSSIKKGRESISPAGFSPGHRKSQSQSSVSWR